MPHVIARILDRIDIMQSETEEDDDLKELLQHLQKQSASIRVLLKIAQDCEEKLQEMMLGFEHTPLDERDIVQELDFITQQGQEYEKAFLFLIEEIL